MSLYTGIYALSCGLNANYSFVLFLIRQLEQLSFELTFDPDLQVWWPYPNDPFVCKHGETAVIEGQGHGQKLGHFWGDIWCLWNTFERNYITHQFHRLKVIVFSSISQHFIFCNFSFSFTKTDLINIVQQTIYDDTIFSGEKTLKCFTTLYNLNIVHSLKYQAPSSSTFLSNRRFNLLFNLSKLTCIHLSETDCKLRNYRYKY